MRAEWDKVALKDVLATVKEELGLPNGAGLTADLDDGWAEVARTALEFVKRFT